MSTPFICPLCDSQVAELYAELQDVLLASPGEWTLFACQAPSCGSVSLLPQPLPTELQRAYADYPTHAVVTGGDSLLRRVWLHLSRAYATRRFGYPAAAGRSKQLVSGALAELIAHLPGRRADLAGGACYLSATAGGRLLEIGCGAGGALARMAKLGWQPTGLDFDPQAAAAARSRGFTVHVGALHEQTFEDLRFDAVLLQHVIEHLPEPRADIERCFDLLEPGGQLVVLTPNVASAGHRRWGRHWRGLEPPRHLCLFTPQALTRLAQNAGFIVDQCTTTGRAGDIEAASRAAARLAEGKQPPGRLARRGYRIWDEAVEWYKRRADPNQGSELLLRAHKPEVRTS